MPRTRMDELYTIAEEHDGLLTSKEARSLGIQDSVLVRLAQRGRLERVSRGVYRIAHYPADKFAPYREAVLWAQASHHGPESIALSHETALLFYGISDLNPARVHLTVPKSARFRRECPAWVTIHRADLTEREIVLHEGIPVTTISRSISDVLWTTHRTEVARQAIAEALHDGLLNSDQARELRKLIKSTEDAPSPSTRRKGTGHDSASR